MTDILDDLQDWASEGDGHSADERGFCRVCSLRMPCDISVMVADLQNAAAEIERLRARVVEAEEYVARYDAVMETMSIDFEDMFPDWSASDD